MPTIASLIHGIDYTIVFARNLPAMRHFYQEVMQFPVRRELGPQWVEMAIGSNILALTERGLMFNDPPAPEGTLTVQLAFRVAPAEVEQCRELLQAKGVATDQAVDQPWGHRTLFFRDPDGNVLEIYAEI